MTKVCMRFGRGCEEQQRQRWPQAHVASTLPASFCSCSAPGPPAREPLRRSKGSYLYQRAADAVPGAARAPHHVLEQGRSSVWR
eukprot:673147-Pleurochrysis_carterae.AAC.1